MQNVHCHSDFYLYQRTSSLKTLYSFPPILVYGLPNSDSMHLANDSVFFVNASSCKYLVVIQRTKPVTN